MTGLLYRSTEACHWKSDAYKYAQRRAWGRAPIGLQACPKAALNLERRVFAYSCDKYYFPFLCCFEIAVWHAHLLFYC